MNIVEQYQAFLKEGLFSTTEQDMAKHTAKFAAAMGHPGKSNTVKDQQVAMISAAHIAQYDTGLITSTNKKQADYNNTLATRGAKLMDDHHGLRTSDVVNVSTAVHHAKKIAVLLDKGR
jgi:hypothetical protein